jgi:hypothetical protein
MKPAACDDLLVGLTVVIVDDHAGFRSAAGLTATPCGLLIG